MFIECPSGLSGEIRRFKVGDYDLFGDVALANRNGPAVSSSICKRLWQETTSQGPYRLNDKNMPNWLKDVVEHDRFYILMQARMATRGNEYDQEMECSKKSCGEEFTWTVPLHELEVKKAPQDVLDGLMNGNRFDVVLPYCNKTVTFGLPTFDVQRRMEVESNRHGRKLSSMFAGRIHNVEDIQSRGEIYDFVADMDGEDWETLREAISDVDFGVETEIEVVCPSCGKKQKHELVMGRDFFMGG